MNRPIRVVLTVVNEDRDGISVAQQTGGAANLTITGALASGGTVTFVTPYRVEFYSAGNLSARTFTITGTDQWGNAQTEAVTGPNAGDSTSVLYFKTVTQIAVSGAVATDVEVGNADELAYVIALDVYRIYTSVYVDIGGTINYDLQKCGEVISLGGTPNWVAGGLTGQTADNNTAYSAPTGGVRLKVNSHSDNATIAFNVNTGR